MNELKAFFLKSSKDSSFSDAKSGITAENNDELRLIAETISCNETISKSCFTPVVFNVGGSHFQLSFLNVLRSSTLSRLIKSECFASKDWMYFKANLRDDDAFRKKLSKGIFIDRDPCMFASVVRYLRTGELDVSNYSGINQSSDVSVSTAVSLSALRKEFTFFALEWPEQCFHCSCFFDPERNSDTSCFHHPGKIVNITLPDSSKRLLFDCCYRMHGSPGCQQAPHLSYALATGWLVSETVCNSNGMASSKRGLKLEESDCLSEREISFIEPCKDKNTDSPSIILTEKLPSTTDILQEHEQQKGSQNAPHPRAEHSSFMDAPPAVWRIAPEEGTEMPLVMESAAAKKSQSGKMKIELDVLSDPNSKGSKNIAGSISSSLKESSVPQVHSERDLGCLKDDAFCNASFFGQRKLSNSKWSTRGLSISKSASNDIFSRQDKKLINKACACADNLSPKNSEKETDNGVLESMNCWRMHTAQQVKNETSRANKNLENESEQCGVSIDSLNQFQHPLYKTKMCPFMKNGCCSKKSDNCNFAHSLEDLRSTNNFHKTKMCAFWLTGYCKAGTHCRHAHGEGEIRYRESNITQSVLTPADPKIIWFRLGGYYNPVPVTEISHSLVAPAENLYAWK